jgi:hypothetical protein
MSVSGALVAAAAPHVMPFMLYCQGAFGYQGAQQKGESHCAGVDGVAPRFGGIDRRVGERTTLGSGTGRRLR